MTDTTKLNVLILAHDLSDAAIARRTQMLRVGGASVVVAGFRRTLEPVYRVAGCTTVNFGQTRNRGFLHRVASIFRLIVFLPKHRSVFVSADIILARNLEMLALAVWGRLILNRKAAIVYEVLDIHRLLLRKDPIGFCLRWVEGGLSRFARGVITSSPAFVENYFNPMSRVRVPINIVENKVIEVGAEGVETHNVKKENRAPPWIIGWFGVIRCRKSLDILTKLVKSSQGRIEVVIRGRPAFDQFDDFYKQVTNTKGLMFAGPCSNPHDLCKIYSEVHFTWAIDKFEEGLNSSWLLSNRLYEGGLFGAIPIAQDHVETGKFIKALGVGLTIVEPEEESLKLFFDELTEEQYQSMRKSALAVPHSTWVHTIMDCSDLVHRLKAYKEQRE